MKLFIFRKTTLLWIATLTLLAVVLVPWGIYRSLPTATQHKDLPIYSVDNNQKEIAITFDSAWGNEDLPQIMETLNAYDCKATFFVVGDFIDRFPGSVKALADAGHEIANHSNSHAHFNALSRESMISDMDACDAKIKQITGKDNVIFRAPYGEYNSLLVRTCKETGRFCMQWDVDTLDTKQKRTN